ncbi:MAG: stage II sporulation protein R [Clostridia bacterium]|nr:stage II sporulation protein R [Clostridia bacterium]
MKLITTILISAIVFFTLQSVFPTEKEYEIYNSTVRLHVLANSDEEKDQELKLKVRDKILERVSAYEASSRDEALELIEQNKQELIDIAAEVIKEEGFLYEVDIEVGQEFYQTRYYEDFALPAGEYTSVKVKIGEGKGQNWWCVLYPPLCTNQAIALDEEACIEVGLTKDQYNLITENADGEYKIKFRLLEIMAQAFGYEY